MSYRFIRTATVKTGAAMPNALRFASEVTAYMNKRYSLNMKFGAELFGASKLHWHFDTDSLDKIQQLNAQLMEDREYLGLLDKYKDAWVDGSIKDTLVTVLGG
ncbi:MAG: hypothetical protein JOY60_11295 [Burkholderiaceae bacterium]|nr:hypothetical protein [Roseateles sp.]MBV8470427.1 hypothetical protein [Burkholderiaceae bacterium]